MLMIVLGFLSYFIVGALGAGSYLYTSSSGWFGNSTDINSEYSVTMGINDCVKNLGYQPAFVTSGLSLLSNYNSMVSENMRLSALNIVFAIGEQNNFLEFVFPTSQPPIVPISPIYPNDAVVMAVVLSVFNTISRFTNPMKYVLVIYNHTQDYNNLAINNYLNIMNSINGQNWSDVKFLAYTTPENVIYTLRLQTYFNIISLLYDPNVNQILVQKVFFAHLMVWRFRWVIVDLLGGTNYLNNTVFGQGVVSNNVTIITFAQNSLSGRAILLQSAFNATISVNCSALPIITSTLSGSFLGNNRTNYIFVIYQNPGNRSVTVGTVSYDIQSGAIVLPSNLSPINYQLTDATSSSNIQLTGFSIGFVQYPPFSMMNGPNYTGFMMEVLINILRDYNITPTIVPIAFSQLGSFNATTLNYSGLLGMVQNGTIDTVSVPFIITIDRINMFDIATNVISGYIAGIYQNPKLTGFNALLLYTYPFDWRVWVTLLCCALGVALALTLADFFFPYKYSRYKFLMSIFFSFSSLTHGAYFDPPHRSGARIIMCFWWLFCLFVVVIWISNYAALLAQQKETPTLTSFRSLLSQVSYKYTALNDSVVFNTLDNNPYQTAQTIERIMLEETINGSVGSITDALTLVNNGTYVFISDDKTILYYANQNCLSSLGNWISFDYGIFLPKYSEKTVSIYNKLTQRMANGNFSALYTKYWPMYNSSCSSTNLIDLMSSGMQKLIPNTFNSALDIDKMIGVFVIVIIGSVCTLILALIEKLIRHLILRSQEKRDKYKYENTVEQLTQF